MKLLWTWGGLAMLAAQAWGQAALPPALEPAADQAGPAPLAVAVPMGADLDNVVQLSDRGRAALANGIAAEAVNCFEKALAIPNLDAATKDSLNLDLTTAYLSEDRLDQAAQALQVVTDVSTPAYLLRATLLKAREGQWDGVDGAAAQLARVNAGALSAVDLPWYYTVQARLAEHQGNADAAAAAWQQAIDHAPVLLKDQFEVAQWDSKVVLSKVLSADEVAQLQAQMAAAATPARGAQLAFPYAVGLDHLGRHDEALKTVEDWVGKTDLDPKNRDTLRLLLVYLEGKSPAATDPQFEPQALEEAILREPTDVSSPDRDAILQMQEQALSLLEQQTLAQNPEKAASASDPADLDKFVEGIIGDQDPESHPLLKELYLFKAQLALILNQPTEAAQAANQLLAKYPPNGKYDPYAAEAQLVLAQVAWNDGKPGKPGDTSVGPRLTQSILLNVYSYKDLPADLRPRITRSLAYLYFMNGDYANAAQVYASLLQNQDPDSPISRGDLLLRVVESYVLAKQIDAAANILDNSALLGGVTADERWRAEWDLLIAMQQQGRAEDAFQRLNKKLDPNRGRDLLKPELYLRLLWLKAYLAVGRSEPGAGAMAEDLQKAVEALTPEAVAGLLADERAALDDLRPKLLADALLLQGESQGQAGQYDQQHKTFDNLRQEYKDSDAALQSYFDEADVQEAQGKTVEAQRLMNAVVQSTNPDFAPQALFNNAVYAAELDKTGEYPEALALLAKFVKDYTDQPTGQTLIYTVKFMQAELYLRRGGKNPSPDADPAKVEKENIQSQETARDLFAQLIKDYPDNPRMPEAKLDHADCLFNLATTGGSEQQREDAMEEYQVLYNQTGLPVEYKVEAGYKRGRLVQNGKEASHLEDAADAYFTVVKDILMSSDKSLLTDLDKSPKGHYWMSLCLDSLYDIYKSKPSQEQQAESIKSIMGCFNLGTPGP